MGVEAVESVSDANELGVTEVRSKVRETRRDSRRGERRESVTP